MTIMSSVDLLRSCAEGEMESLQRWANESSAQDIKLLEANSMDKNGRNVLHLVLDSQYFKHEGREHLYKIVDKLIAFGVDPLSRDKVNGYTCLHYAVKNLHDIEVLSLLMRNMPGSLSDYVGFDGNSVLDALSDALEPSHRSALQGNLGGCVVTFGKSDLQLGYTTEQNVQAIPRQVDFPEGSNDITQVSGGRFHTVALNRNGDVFTWGQGNGGRLGLGDELTYLLPTPLLGLSEKRIVKVTAGRDHTLALCSYGDVYGWGSDRFGQLGFGSNRLESENPASVKTILHPKRIRIAKPHAPSQDIAASPSHSVAVMRNGEVYTWGLNDRGQLGYRSTSTGGRARRTGPKLVETFSHGLTGEKGMNPESIRARLCTAAEGISCIATVNGKVWQWGRGSLKPSRVRIKRNYKKVAESNHDACLSPAEWVQKEETAKIINLSAGPNHVAAVSDHGEVYTWGTYADLLGHSTKGCDRTQISHTATAIRVDTLYKQNRRIVEVSCAKRHTCAIDSAGQLWAWGHGDHGILGISGENGYETYQPSPTRVPTLRKVVCVAAADAHTSAIVGAYKPDFKTLVESDGNEMETEAASIPCDSEDLDESLLFGEDFSSDEESQVQKNSNETVYRVPSLVVLAQESITSNINVWNVLQTLSFADSVHAAELVEYCRHFISKNLDAVIVACPGSERFLTEFYSSYGNGYSSTTAEMQRFVSTEENAKDMIAADASPSKVDSNVCAQAQSRSSMKKRLKQLQKKLNAVEDAEFRMSAVKSAKKRGARDKLESLDKLALKTEIEHLRDSLGINDYKSTLNKLSSTLKSVQRENEKLFCRLCQIQVPDEDAMVEHVSGKRHRKMMSRRQSTDVVSPASKASSIRSFIEPVEDEFVTPVKLRERITRSAPIAVPGKAVRSAKRSSRVPINAALASKTVNQKFSTSLSSSIGSNCSWHSSGGYEPVNMIDIMNAEAEGKKLETGRACKTLPTKKGSCYEWPDLGTRPAASSPVPTSGKSNRALASSFHVPSGACVSPVSVGKGSQNSLLLGSFMRESDRQTYSHSPSAWGSIDRDPVPISKVALNEIQNQQQSEGTATRSLATSSWGFNQTRGESLTNIQQEQAFQEFVESQKRIELQIKQQQQKQERESLTKKLKGPRKNRKKTSAKKTPAKSRAKFKKQKKKLTGKV
mmetsp:Transcript_3982/g.4478  ORF Transcript_3982/g.4478 Transcript_3982/m.4478 type:complete len:1170 (-) Transcript_3982:395-3904(-)